MLSEESVTVFQQPPPKGVYAQTQTLKSTNRLSVLQNFGCLRSGLCCCSGINQVLAQTVLVGSVVQAVAQWVVCFGALSARGSPQPASLSNSLEFLVLFIF